MRRLARLNAGVSIALAMQTPTLNHNESFGLRAGWGNFDGNANAFGVSMVGVVCRDCLGFVDRFTIDAGAALGTSTYYNYNSGTAVGARVGAQLTWR
jgi:trimeric autotransporter adhesin